MKGDLAEPFTRVLLVDDFAPFRRIIVLLFQPWQPQVQCVGEGEDGVEAVQKCLEPQPGLVLLDVELPTLSGSETARQIRRLVSTCSLGSLADTRFASGRRVVLARYLPLAILSTQTAGFLPTGAWAAREDKAWRKRHPEREPGVPHLRG